MPKITPFLWFDGQAEQAAKFYTSVFKPSKILEIRREAKRCTSAIFRMNGQTFIAFNGGPHFKFTPAISLFVDCRTQREVDVLWRKLLQGGGKPSRCGWLTDRYGLSWQIIPSILGEMLEDPDPAKSARVWRAMMKMVKIDVQALRRAYAGS